MTPQPVDFLAGGYRYMPGVSQYSGGVAALPGHEITRVRFRRPVPLADGLVQIEQLIAAADRPLAAFCACELRSPAPFTEAGFKAFNAAYCSVLERWGVYRDGINSVARSNVCPEIDPPTEPAFHAFCYTVPAATDMASFVVSGSGEVPEGKANYRDHIIRRGETSADALRDKARFVLAEMERRLRCLGVGWADTTASQAYTVFDLHPFLAGEIVARGAAAHGLTWHLDRPPIVDIDFEMDCRGLATERVV